MLYLDWEFSVHRGTTRETGKAITMPPFNIPCTRNIQCLVDNEDSKHVARKAGTLEIAHISCHEIAIHSNITHHVVKRADTILWALPPSLRSLVVARSLVKGPSAVSSFLSNL